MNNFAELRKAHDAAKENGTFDEMLLDLQTDPELDKLRAEMLEDKDGTFAALRAEHDAALADGTFDEMFLDMETDPAFDELAKELDSSFESAFANL